LIELGSADEETVHGWKHEKCLDKETWSEQQKNLELEVFEQNIL
jgi:hypothetical protein